MKSNLFNSAIALATALSINLKASETAKRQISFQENKGQICDQNFKPRPDVLFSGAVKGMVYHLTNSGISYQLSKVEKWNETIEKKSNVKLRAPEITSIYRIDVKWLGINENLEIEKGQALPEVANYYLQQCPSGALNVKSYSSLIYKNIYDGINLKWYERNENLEYDFIVAPNADINQIKLQINGSKKISINKDGELEITTPYGVIIEKHPVAYQDGKEIKASWAINKNELQFNVPSYDHSKVLTIDPIIRLWGTYYGGTLDDLVSDVTIDATNNSYAVGYTSSTTAGTIIATAGAFQTTHGAGGGIWDAFVVKFNTSGIRQWATFYGGVGADYAVANAIDGSPTPNLYVTGYSSSTGSVITTAGAHQTTNSGGFDAFILKFNSLTGARIWSTFYGNTNNDYGYDCATDGANNIIAVGTTSNAPTSTLIATPGSHQPATGFNTDGFIVKFNSAGVRQWGSYYGGTTNDFVYGCSVEKTSNDIAFVGLSSGSPSGIVTPGAYSNSGNPFIVKFNQSGVRQWGTYYTTGINNRLNSCVINSVGDVYAVGTNTNPTSGVASPGSHQTTAGGGSTDAFLVKISANGASRLWGTYYGGAGADAGMECSLDNAGNVYIVGNTTSTTNISSFGNHQTTFGGGSVEDAFVAGFDASGVRYFGSYYGGALADFGWSCKPDGSGNLYIGGSTAQTGATGIISTTGSHQSNYGGGAGDGYVAKFMVCQNLTLTIAGTSSLCAGSSATLAASGTGFTTYTWSTGPSTTSISVSPSITTTYTLTAGTASAGCVYQDVQTVTVGASPTVNISSGSSTVCSGSTVSLTANGASTYTWNTGATTTVVAVSPTITTVYTATGTSALGCTDTQTISISTVANPTISVAATSTNVCSGAIVTLTASGASTYAWSNGSTNTITAVSPSITTIYTATGTAVSGCKDTQTISINVTTTPTLATTHYTICAGGTATLSASGATTYSWSTSATTSSITVTPASNTTYTVTGYNGTCTDVNTVSVTVGSSISIAVTPTAPAVCIGNSLTLSATGATSYTWSTGSNSTSIVVSPTTNTTYTISGTSGSCSGTRTIAVVANANPTVAAVSSSSLICTGNSATLSATGASSYNWNPGSLSGTSVVVSPTINTTYTVVGSNAAGCTNTRTVSVTVSACTGINEAQVTKGIISIYPNPNNGEFTLIVPEQGLYTIVNSIGQIIQTIELKEDSQTISVQGLADGIYYIIGKSAKAKIVVSK